jgi:hypothetical protein
VVFRVNVSGNYFANQLKSLPEQNSGISHGPEINQSNRMKSQSINIIIIIIIIDTMKSHDNETYRRWRGIRSTR